MCTRQTRRKLHELAARLLRVNSRVRTSICKLVKVCILSVQPCRLSLNADASSGAPSAGHVAVLASSGLSMAALGLPIATVEETYEFRWRVWLRLTHRLSYARLLDILPLGRA